MRHRQIVSAQAVGTDIALGEAMAECVSTPLPSRAMSRFFSTEETRTKSSPDFTCLLFLLIPLTASITDNADSFKSI